MKKANNQGWLKQAGQALSHTPYLPPVMFLLVVTLFVLAQTFDHTTESYVYQIGDVAGRDIKAPKDFFIEDKATNLAKMNSVETSVRTVYDFDANLLGNITSGIASAMHFGWGMFHPPDNTPKNTPPESPEAALPESQETASPELPELSFSMALALKPEFEKKLGIKISKGAFQILFNEKFSEEVTGYLTAIISTILTNGVVSNKEILLAEEEKGITLRTIQPHKERVVTNLKVYYGPDQAKSMVRVVGQPILKGVNYSLANLVVDICQRLLRPNITLNKNETQKRIREAQAKIKPTLYQIKAGEMIIREGERVDELKLVKLNTLNEQVEDKDVIMTISGIGMFTSLLLIVVYFLYLKDHPKLSRDMNKHMAFLTLGLLLYIGFTELAVYIAHASNPEMTGKITSNAIYMVVPLPAAAMITCIFLGFDIALYFSLVLCSLCTISFGGGFQVFLFFFLSSITAAYWIKERNERHHFIVAGFKLAIFNACLAIALGFFMPSQALPWGILTKQVTMAVGGGVFAAILTVGFTPLIEVLFNYTTAAKLLEFSNLDQPLIKKLMIEAPGTYNHSVIVATLAEAAASAIHADSLKAKVMAYYHDIGKLDKTMYFIENQSDGRNRHDKLSPSMSALILIGHVKKGVEIAKQYKLGNEIVEGIIQHHGTSLIKYFYNKSLKAGNENINEDDFRYPGPKPQTREAGIVMLADVVEAATRALERPTPSRIKGRVKELINDIFADGQLEECEMTLKDLHQIAKSFNNILTSIYHSRIEYTDKTQDKKQDKKNGKTKDTDRQPTKGEAANGAPAPKDRTDLKRLGL
ncbi:HDIG domain-containing metalloprotein [uncultured Desulfobacter sp.]|uniref:HD family phosphohydrolase n=1 Tax=uncultured Desulfobacter sp. TaxID=240139 RepID=UPI0029F5C6C8|nr:HDIG domain-containing metalloprotein [uncultured Desulfobacter sp.]